MPLITVKAATPLIPAGTYPADLIAINPKSLVTQYSKLDPQTGLPIAQDFLEWQWLVHGEHADIDINSLTTLSTGPKSTMFKVLAALLGRTPQVDEGFDENDLVGKSILVATIVNDEGFAKIDQYMAMPKLGKATATGPGRPATKPTTPHEALMVAAPGQVAAPDLSPDPDEPTTDDDDLPF